GEGTDGGKGAGVAITFRSANWNVAQTGTVTGVDDFVQDGDVGYSIVTGVQSTDAVYASIKPDDVQVTNRDNDHAGVTVTPTSGLFTTESGRTATFRVVLTSQPTANVTVTFASSNTAEGTPGANATGLAITFTPANWGMPQTVTVTGVDDFVQDGDVDYTIVTGVQSTDAVYAAIKPADVHLINIDNDHAG